MAHVKLPKTEMTTTAIQRSNSVYGGGGGYGT